jgi:cephalosporin hydroxylase
MKLKDIHLNYETDKGVLHSYIETYDELFFEYQNKKINFLEIGCATCASLKMFNEYFLNATLYGVDDWSQGNQGFMQVLCGFGEKKYAIRDLISEIKNNYPKINLVTCNSTDLENVNDRFKDTKFDIVIDDGDHTHEAQFKTFKNFIPKLNSGGVYIVEDVRHHKILSDNIKQYIEQNNLNLSVTVKDFGITPQGWDDDVLVIIK